MSIQPLKPSDSRNLESGNLSDILEIAKQLLQLPDIESQLAYMVDAFRRYFSCSVLLWIAEPYSNILQKQRLEVKVITLSDKSDLITQAFIEKRLLTSLKSLPENLDLAQIVAAPLLCKDDVLGVIQLEKSDEKGFIHQEIELIRDLCLQVSILLELKIQEKIFIDEHKKQDLLMLVTQIGKSISSNLDLDNLLNSVLTLIHQNFKYLKVNLFVSLGENNNLFTRISITNAGIEQSDQVHDSIIEGPLSWVISHREYYLINNYDLDQRFSSAFFDPEIKSELAIPLISGNQLFGILDLCSDLPESFGANEISGLLSLSEQISIAIRNAKLFKSEQLRRQIAEDMNQVLSSVSAETAPEEVYNKILPELEKFLPYDAAAMWLLENDSSKGGIDQFITSLSLASINISNNYLIDDSQKQNLNADRIKDRLLDEEHYINDESAYPWLSELINSKIPTILDTQHQNEPLGKVMFFTGHYSAIAIPLVINDHTLGIILSVHHLPYSFSEESSKITETFANFASVAIENTRLFSGAHDQVWMSTLLLQVAETSQSISTMDELIQSTANMLVELVGANACTLYLWDESLFTFYPQISYGFDEVQQARLNEWDVVLGSIPAFDQLVENKSPVVLDSNTLPDEICTLIFPMYDLSTNLLILFPMFFQDEIVGAILIDFTGTKLTNDSSQKTWDDMYAIIQGVSHQTAIAIEKLQIIKAREEEAYISVALLQVAQAIVSFNQLDEILSSIVRITPILVGVKRCLIYLWDKLDLVFRASQYYGFSRNDIKFESQLIRSTEFPLIQISFNQNQIAYYQLAPNDIPSDWSEIQSSDVHVIDKISSDNEEQITIKLDQEVLQEKARLLIGFPLSVKGEVLGVMLIEEEDPIKGSPSYHIREKRIEIVRGITQQAALAIKNEQLLQDAVNSEKMERELQLAREIQQTFLPHDLPKFHGWDIDICWQPARQVAGDFYDILLLDENKMGFVIADVADKGMPAALFMTLIRTLIRAAAKENSSPAAVLKQVNELLFQDSKNGMFVTTFYGVFDLNSGKVIYANAGHNPPLVKYAHGNGLVELTRTSMALGIFYDIDVEEREVQLSSGDWILLYTDGVTEAFSINEEMYGVKRLYNLLEENHFESSKDLVDVIDISVHEFIKGVDLSDDLTIAAIIKK